MLTGSGGTITSRFSFDAYGRTLNSEPGTLNAPATSLLYSGEQFDTDLQNYYLRARYYDPSNGRFNRLDPIGGSNSDPQSLHKYAYAHEDPVNQADPSGTRVYVVERPLEIGPLRYLSPIFTHVFLAFDTEDLTYAGFNFWWQFMVPASNFVYPGPMAGVPPYTYTPELITFSFHPYSVLTGGDELKTLSVVLTKGSYVAYNDDIDKKAYKLAKQGAGRYRITAVEPMSDQLQFSLYLEAIHSRDINNASPTSIDPNVYALFRTNCGSWTQYIIEKHTDYPAHPNQGCAIKPPPLRIPRAFLSGPNIPHAYDVNFSYLMTVGRL